MQTLSTAPLGQYTVKALGTDSVVLKTFSTSSCKPCWYRFVCKHKHRLSKLGHNINLLHVGTLRTSCTASIIGVQAHAWNQQAWL